MSVTSAAAPLRGLDTHTQGQSSDTRSQRLLLVASEATYD